MFNLDAGEGELNGVNGVYYSYDYGNVHFTVLNSNDMYPMTEAQRNWIYNDITASDAHWKVLLLHRAAYSAGKNINKPDTLIMRETILEIVDDTGVDLVLSGHRSGVGYGIYRVAHAVDKPCVVKGLLV